MTTAIVEKQCPDCGNLFAGSERLCLRCVRQRRLFDVTLFLSKACEAAHLAYAAHPGGEWGREVSALKLRLIALAQEAEKIVGM